MNLVRRNVLKAFAATGACTAMPSAVRSTFAGEDADVVLKLIAAPGGMNLGTGERSF